MKRQDKKKIGQVEILDEDATIRENVKLVEKVKSIDDIMYILQAFQKNFFLS
jgi:hypothetical protein